MNKCLAFDGRTRLRMPLSFLLLSIVLILLNGKVLAGVEQLSLKWGELRSIITDRKIETVLVEGIALKGKVVTVTADSVELDISQTSDRVKYPKGKVRVPRSSLSTLQFKEVRGRWRAIGTAIGAGAGACVGIPFYKWGQNELAEEKGAAIMAGWIGTGAALGFLAGRSTDKRTVIVSIVPD